LPLRILQAGEEVLRMCAAALTPEQILSDDAQALIAAMQETMRAAPGVGLAAPQIGIPWQLAVIEDPEEFHASIPETDLAERERRHVPFHVIINPVIELLGDERREFFEGCLSVDGFSAIVPRARQVRVQCLNEKAEPQVIEASGWYARILQHEIDHLHGRLYIDRMYSRTFMTVENQIQFWKGKSIAEALSRLEAKS